MISALVVGVIITWNGVNHHYDDMWYVVYARSIQTDWSLSVPISSYYAPHTLGWINQWPPLYPMLLAVGVGLDILVWGRILTIAILMACTVMVYGLALRLIDGRWRYAYAAAMLFLLFPVTTRDGFAYIHSETAFTLLALIFLMLLLPYRLGHAVPVRGAVWAAFVVVLLTLTRYVGVAFGALGLGWFCLWGITTRTRTRWIPFVAFGLSFIPITLYAFYLKGVSGSFTGSQTTADPFSFSGLPNAVYSILREMVGGLNVPFLMVGLRSNWWGVGVLVGLMTLMGWYALRHENRLRALLDQHHLMAVGYSVGYFAVFFVMGARSRIITEETTRHYIVLFPVLWVLVVSVLSRIQLPRWLLGGMLLLYVVRGMMVLPVPAYGLNYNLPTWRNDPLLQQLQANPPQDTLVHTQYNSYLSWRLGDSVPIRTFGSITAFETVPCEQLVFPAPYRYALFTLIDSAYVRDHPLEQVEQVLTNWALPCGTVVAFESSGFTTLMTMEIARPSAVTAP